MVVDRDRIKVKIKRKDRTGASPGAWDLSTINLKVTASKEIVDRLEKAFYKALREEK